jgi:hypothetical protein
MKRHLAAVITLAIIFSNGLCAGNTIWVAVDGNDLWDGQAQSFDGVHGPKKTLTGAVNASSDNDTVIIMPGVYSGPYNCSVLVSQKSLKIRSIDPNDPFTVESTIFDSNGLSVPGEIKINYTFKLSGISFTGQRWKNVIICENAAEIDHCRFYGCTGILVGVVSCKIENCEFRDNTGTVYCTSDGEIKNCKFMRNSNVNSFILGIYGSSKIKNCEFSENTSMAIYLGNNFPGKSHIENCLFHNNTNTSIVSYAGACIKSDRNVIIDGCTFANNDGGKQASARVLYLNVTSGNNIVRNCVFKDNNSSPINSNSPTIISYSCYKSKSSTSYVLPGEYNINKDPLLRPDFHTASDSPCRDAGDPNYINYKEYDPNLKDLDGEGRIAGGRVDIGCDEFTDSDGDKLPDYWENKYFGEAGTTAEADSDGDGRNNLEEYDYTFTDPTVAGRKWYVDPNMSVADGNGLGWATAKKYIYDAIKAAADGDFVILKEGVHYPGGFPRRANDGNGDAMGKLITIQSTDPENESITGATIIERDLSFRNGETRGCSLRGITIMNSSFGGIFCENASPTIYKC